MIRAAGAGRQPAICTPIQNRPAASSIEAGREMCIRDRLRRELRDRGMVLLVAGGHGQFRMALERSGLAERIGRDKIFPSPEQAVEAIERWRQGPAPATLS